MGKNCPECNSDYMESPDDSVYYTGPDYKELGIKKGMPYKQLVQILLRTIPVPGGETQAVSSSDVSVPPPPPFIVTDYNMCWEKVAAQKGWYQLTENNGLLTFSYDFTDAVTSLPGNLELKKIKVDIGITEDGLKKNYISGSEKSSSAISLETTKFPISLSIVANIGSAECSEMILYYNLSLGNIPTDKRYFMFAVRGVDGKVGTKYSQDDVDKMIYAKLAQLSNFVDTIRAGDYLNIVNRLSMENEILAGKLKEEKRYQISSGIGKLSFTEAEFMAYVVDEIKKMKEQLLKV